MKEYHLTVFVIYLTFFPLSLFFLSRIYKKILISQSQRKIYLFSILALVYSVFPAIILLYAYNAIYVTLFLCFFFPFISLYAFFIPFDVQKSVYKDKETIPTYLKVANIIVGLSLFISFSGYPVLSVIMSKQCDNIHHNQAKQIINAMTLYKEEYGVYPDKSELIISGYLPKDEWPIPICFVPIKTFFSSSPTYSIRECDESFSTIIVNSTMGSGPWIYDFDTGLWRYVDPLGGCICKCQID